MSSQERLPPDQMRRSAGALRSPACPQCAQPMVIKQITPVLFASGLDDILFGCDSCRTEAKRTVKRA